MPSFSELMIRLLSFEFKEFGSGISDAEIATAETVLELRVEGSYRQFLRKFGWGSVEHLELYGLGGPPHLDLIRVTISERAEMEPPLPAHFLPVMNDGGGNLFCLDTNIKKEPPVVFWDHNGDRNQIAEIEGVSFTLWLWEQLNSLES